MTLSGRSDFLKHQRKFSPMGHQTRGILGSDQVVSEFAKAWLRDPVPLGQGMSFLPVSDDLLDSINELVDAGDEPAHSEFHYLSQSLAEVVKRQSFQQTIVYFETEYFGGVGSQSAIVWKRSEVEFGPKKSTTKWDETNMNHVVDNGWPINEALRLMGVYTDGSTDEFDTLGLGQYRSMDE